MNISGLEKLSKFQITQRAVELLEKVCPNYLDRPTAIPIMKVVEYLRANYNISFDFQAKFPLSAGSNLLGAYVFSKKLILIDSELASNEKRFNFTLAHEIGHWLLHRNVKILGNRSDIITDDSTIIGNGPRKLHTDYDWMEWQANYLASSLLMPPNLIKASLIKIQAKNGISKQGIIFLDIQYGNIKDYNNIIIGLSDLLAVSKQAIEFRLRDLGLIIDQRSPFHISKFIDIYLKEVLRMPSNVIAFSNSM
ncbi:ImmA/IrrE family metallo-endopeptidase [Chitinophaga oryzae]|uniref:ImmA/IrrE family metallo-endopeptidase n=1 Tax=Chitinophaga oryzae TaxID=2725414 RepID=A0ABX6LNL2_9BACT|nr:ImmA/IrrE family metallo-endopeptidase [Chitinophaga oryzae]QJB41712.1 ImmA/IrrE family metallo-endopeptidase [Chitinophaga oryzae]